MEVEGAMPPPPFEVVENAFTWLGFSDLVFVDPVDTGYSKAATDELRKKFLSVEGDLGLNAEFIRRFLSRHKRWSSPLFLGGESYGTFRSAGLAGNLLEQGIAFNGVILVSSVLELGTLLFESGDDLPYLLYVPSYAATAWFHGRLEPALQERPLADLLAEVETWTMNTYTIALARGHALPAAERDAVRQQLSRYTGLPEDQIERWDLRISGPRFCNELLRESRRIAGRLDSRHTGFDPEAATDNGTFDPSMSAIRPPFTAAFNAYVRDELRHETEEEYHILRGLDWTWGDAHEGAPRTTAEIEEAFSRNPYLHLLVLSGYYDLATPYFATQYTLGRLRIDPGIRDQIVTVDYPGGHMMYIAHDILEQMQQDVAAFVEKALATPQKPLRPAG
jgi:carboxypeptidase C (cathepsin A)